MDAKITAITLAVVLTVVIGLLIPWMVNSVGIISYVNVTIADEPSLIKALQDSQTKGVLLGICSSESVDYSALTPLQAKDLVANDINIFNKSGLTPTVFISPPTSLSALTPSIREAMESTGVPTRLPPLQANDSGLIEYSPGWRDMTNFSDPRYAYESQSIARDQPTSILVDVHDWNPFSKRLLSDYLASTNQKNVTIRVDSIDVNTPVEKIYDMSDLLQYPSVGRIVYAITPSGARIGDPRALGLSITTILEYYWWYFVLTTFFPLTFFIIWRDIEKYKEDRKRRLMLKSPQNNRYMPSVSIVIPAYNEEKVIRTCLEAALKQDYKGDVDIILVNDGSTDRTAEIVAEYPVQLIDLKRNVGKANALNIGLAKASGEVIVFSDSDSFLASNAITALVKRFEESPDAHIVAGNVFVHDVGEKGRILRYLLIIEYKMEQYINRYLQSLKGAILVCPGPLFAVKREVTDRIKYSDKTLVEDADFTIQALKCKMKIIWGPEAKVYSFQPETLWGWYKQRKRWWYGNLQVWRLHNSFVRKNPWFLLSYSGFVTSFLGVITMPIIFILLFIQGDFIHGFALGWLYIILASFILTMIIAPLYLKDWRLLLMLPSYVLFYNTLKWLVLSYIYFCYLRGGTTKIQFGSRVIDAGCSL